MKFIERLFSKKQEKGESHPAVFKFGEIDPAVKAEIKKEENQLQPAIKEKYHNIKQALDELEAATKELLDATTVENISKRGEKLGDSNRDNVVHNLRLINDKLKVPSNTSPSVASDFYKDAKSTLKNMLDNTSKSLLYIKALYPQEYQKINQGIAELEDLIDELCSSIIEGVRRIKKLENISAQTDELQRLQKELEDSNRKMIELEGRYETAKKQLSDDDSLLAELENSGEFEKAKKMESEIIHLDSKIDENTAEARRLFTPLSKAISRMEKQDGNEKCVLSPENRELLRYIKEDPAAAIELDMKPFLTELKNRIDSGELGLKDQMCDKALKQIYVLTDRKIMSSIVEQRKQLIAEKERITAELDSLSIYRKREEAEKDMERHRSNVCDISGYLDSESRHLHNLKDGIEREKSALLSDLKHVFGKETGINYQEQD